MAATPSLSTKIYTKVTTVLNRVTEDNPYSGGIFNLQEYGSELDSEKVLTRFRVDKIPMGWNCIYEGEKLFIHVTPNRFNAYTYKGVAVSIQKIAGNPGPFLDVSAYFLDKWKGMKKIFGVASDKIANERANATFLAFTVDTLYDDVTPFLSLCIVFQQDLWKLLAPEVASRDVSLDKVETVNDTHTLIFLNEKTRSLEMQMKIMPPHKHKEECVVHIYFPASKEVVPPKTEIVPLPPSVEKKSIESEKDDMCISLLKETTKSSYTESIDAIASIITLRTIEIHREFPFMKTDSRDISVEKNIIITISGILEDSDTTPKEKVDSIRFYIIRSIL